MPRTTLIIAILCCSSFFHFSSCSSAGLLCAKFTGFSSNRAFSSCNDLPYLNSFLYWTNNPSSGTVQIAYRSTSPSTTRRRRWVAWAINPSTKGMAGSQALVAFQKSDGSIKVYTSPISTYQTATGLHEGDLSFPVSDLSATYSGNNNNHEITIFATLKLNNLSSTYILNQVWQEGPLSGDVPQIHPTSGPNLNSMATLNLVSGQFESGGGGGGGGEAANSRIKKKNIHGVLNAVSWGIMMPVGVIIARYMKVSKRAEPAWFYFHSACQTTAYIMGIAGWATGLQLGSQSTGIQFKLHRTIGIVLFCLATLQVTALLMRPKKENKCRTYWNMYHHVIGYSIIILGIINIFKGFDILNPNNNKWKRAYVGVIVTLAVIAIFLEVITWIVVLLRRKREKTAAAAAAAQATITTGGGEKMAAAHPNNGFHQYYAAPAGGTRTQSYAATGYV